MRHQHDGPDHQRVRIASSDERVPRGYIERDEVYAE